MKVQLFHAPYVDDGGADRMRLCGVVTNINPDDEGDLAAVEQVKAAIDKCGRETTVLAVDRSIEVEWLR